MKPKVFIHPGDSYIGRNVAKEFQERGYEILTACIGAETPSYTSASYQIGSEDASQIENQFLNIADVVVLELFGHEAAARRMAVQLVRQPFGGKQQALIAISDPLVWATTSPPPPLPPMQDSVWDRAYTTASEHQQMRSSTAGTAAGAAADAAPGPLTDLDVPRRSPCLAARATHEAETTVLRVARKGRIRSHVVCPGLLYGRGESDTFLHPHFQQSWSVDQGTPSVYGSGTNRLPMVHVADLAQYVAELAAYCPTPAAPAQPYLLLVDDAQPTQAEIVTAISDALGTGGVTPVPRERLLLLPGVERYILDLRFAATPLPDACRYRPAFPAGFLAHVPALCAEYCEQRNVAPLRLVVTGAPMSGKTTLALRLAHKYNLTYISIRELLDSVKDAEPELQKAVSAEMSGKEPRVSQKSLAALLHAKLGDKRLRNRGYVLDAFPKSAAAAKFAFMRSVAMSAEEAAREKEAEAATRAVSPGKAEKPGKGAAAKDAKGGKGGKAAAGPVSEGPEVPPGHRLAPDPALAPTHLIQVDVEEAVLKLRLSKVEAAEVEAAKAAAAAAGPPAKGAKEKPLVLSGHNNERDFARRMEAWGKAKQDDAEELAAKVAVAEQVWTFQQAQAAQERSRLEAEANTLRARRRRARLEALGAEGGAKAEEQGEGGVQATSGTMEATGTGTFNGDVTISGQGTAAALGATAGGAAQGPQLPAFGGLVGLLVHDCGVQFLQLGNENVGGAVLLPGTEKGGVKVPDAEAAAMGFLGPPHNFDGFVGDVEAEAEAAQDDGAAAAEHDGAAAEAAAREALAAQRARALDGARAAALHTSAFLSTPLRRWLMAELMPVVTDGLVSVVRDRPAAPLRFLAQRLLQEAERLEAEYSDPYDDPAYEAQAAKIRAKAQREQERAAAARDKDDREMATKLAMRDAEQKAARRVEAATPVPA